MDYQDKLKVLEELHNHGIRFAVDDPVRNRPIYLKPETALKFEDLGEDGYFADRESVPIELYRAWLEWKKGGYQCNATMKNGNRCTVSAQEIYHKVHPRDFEPGKSDRCMYHIQ